MSVDPNDVHELSLDELEAVAGGYLRKPTYMKWPIYVANEVARDISDDIRAFAASQGG